MTPINEANANDQVGSKSNVAMSGPIIRNIGQNKKNITPPFDGDGSHGDTIF